MGKSYKKKQFMRTEGWEVRPKRKENKTEVHKKGRIWIDESDNETAEEAKAEDDQYDNFMNWDPFCFDDDMGPMYDEGQSIFIGGAGLTSYD